MNTGEAIRVIREKLGESQQTFSNRLGSTLITVSRWERNIYTPEPVKLAELAQLASEIGLTEAADVLNRETGVLYRMLGPSMLDAVYGSLLKIKSNIAEFQHSAAGAGLGKDIPQELWNLLDDEVTRAHEAAKVVTRLMAMAPYMGPKE